MARQITLKCSPGSSDLLIENSPTEIEELRYFAKLKRTRDWQAANIRAMDESDLIDVDERELGNDDEDSAYTLEEIAFKNSQTAMKKEERKVFMRAKLERAQDLARLAVDDPDAHNMSIEEQLDNYIFRVKIKSTLEHDASMARSMEEFSKYSEGGYVIALGTTYCDNGCALGVSCHNSDPTAQSHLETNRRVNGVRDAADGTRN